MKNLFSFSRVGTLFFLALGVIGTTTMLAASSSNQVWADVFEGTEEPDVIVGTPEDDIIDSKGSRDVNYGDTRSGEGSENDVIDSGEDNDINFGDTQQGDGSGNDVIISGEGNDFNFGDNVIVSGEEDDTNTGDGGADIFVCGDGEEDTVTDYNEEEGDIATPDCENV